MVTLKIGQCLLNRLPQALTERQAGEACRAAAMEVAAGIKDNFRRIGRGARYWEQARRRVAVAKMTETRKAEVVIAQKGVRLHWKGGTVKPTGRTSEVTGKPTKSLLIPFADSPLRKRRITLQELHAPAENIHVLKSRNGCPCLVAAEHLKKKTKLIWLGKLVKSASFRPRPDVLPSPGEMQRSALRGALARVKKIYERRKTPWTMN